MESPALETDAPYQDEAAVFFDADLDRDLDLYVVSGGYAFQSQDTLLQDRLYINDGNGKLHRSDLPEESLSGSCVVVLDLENDGDNDLFIGTRLIPGAWPLPPVHRILINDGKGGFTARELPESQGMISDAVAADLNRDGYTDLITAGEWSGIRIWTNSNGTLTESTGNWIPNDLTGWWNTLLARDMDGDGDIDLVAGNHGSNNPFRVDADHPATLVFKDFNNDGQTDPFFCYFLDGTSYPYASRDEALTQVTGLKPRYPDYNAYANARLEDMFTPEEIHDAVTITAPELRSFYLENTGAGFNPVPLPAPAQFSPIHALASADIDGDGDPDLITGGNETYTRVRIGKSDANPGLILVNDGRGGWSPLPPARSGLRLNGDARSLTVLQAGKELLLVTGEIGKPVRSFRLNN